MSNYSDTFTHDAYDFNDDKLIIFMRNLKRTLYLTLQLTFVVSALTILYVFMFEGKLFIDVIAAGGFLSLSFVLQQLGVGLLAALILASIRTRRQTDSPKHSRSELIHILPRAQNA